MRQQPVLTLLLYWTWTYWTYSIFRNTVLPTTGTNLKPSSHLATAYHTYKHAYTLCSSSLTGGTLSVGSFRGSLLRPSLVSPPHLAHSFSKQIWWAHTQHFCLELSDLGKLKLWSGFYITYAKSRPICLHRCL